MVTLSFPSAQSTATMGYWNQSLQSPPRPHQQSRSRQGTKLPDTGTAPELPPPRPPPRPGRTLLRAFILLYTKSGNVFRGMNRPAPGVTNMFPSSSTTLPWLMTTVGTPRHSTPSKTLYSTFWGHRDKGPHHPTAPRGGPGGLGI